MLDQKGDADAVNGTAVDVLVDLRSLVGKVDVVPVNRKVWIFNFLKRIVSPVHSMFDDEVEESEGSDERTDDSVGDSKSEHQQHPGVVNSEGELVENCSSNGGNLRLRFGAAQSECVHEELWEPHDLQSRPYEGTGSDVVHKESPVVREEDTLPVDAGVGVPVIILVFLDDSLQK